MIDISHVPPAFIPHIRGVFLAFLGGREKLDCWLNEIADELADPENLSVQPIKIDPDIIPMNFQALMHRPKEVVDILIETTEGLAVFEYRTEVKKVAGGFLAITSDQQTGHIIEETAGPDYDNLSSYVMKKYGQNFEVVKE